MTKSAILLILFILLISGEVTGCSSFSSASLVENSWTTKTPMHESRVSAGAGAIEGKIYVMGGSQRRNISNDNFYVTINSTEVYDPTTDTWTEKASMPTSRSSFGATVYQDKIYCMGGFHLSDDGSEKISVGVNEIYDPSTDAWETKSPMPSVRYGFEANTVDGKIYVIGGWLQSQTSHGEVEVVSSQVDIYDPSTDVWTRGTQMPNAVADYASAVIDQKIYVFRSFRQQCS